MKIEKREHGLPYAVSFEPIEENGLHDVFISANAIAAQTVLPIRKLNPRTEDTWEGRIEDASKDFISFGIDKLMSTMQTRAREKSGNGPLNVAIELGAKREQLSYLHKSLIDYNEDTVDAVRAEMNNVMGNGAAYTRLNEGISAAIIAHVIANELDLDTPEPQKKAPFGFARDLPDHELPE